MSSRSRGRTALADLFALAQNRLVEMSKLYGAGLRALPVKMLAAYTGVELEEPAFTPGITEFTQAFMSKSPNSKVLFDMHICLTWRRPCMFCSGLLDRKSVV